MSINTSRIALVSLIFTLYYGGFSRFTHGLYSPSMHAYQLERAPNNEHTWMIPVGDTILGTSLLFAKTRPWAALLCVLGGIVGIWVRFQGGKDAFWDCALCLLAVVVFLTSIPRR
jgi:hypothetical protein